MANLISPYAGNNMVHELIRDLKLQAHPEGGYYRERHRASHTVTRADGAVRAALTVIDFLLPAGVTSEWHRVHHCRRDLALRRRRPAGTATASRRRPRRAPGGVFVNSMATHPRRRLAKRPQPRRLDLGAMLRCPRLRLRGFRDAWLPQKCRTLIKIAADIVGKRR